MFGLENIESIMTVTNKISFYRDKHLD